MSGLLFLAIERDTRGVDLTPAQRFNRFPASPLCAVTRVREGRLHRVGVDGAVSNEELPSRFVSGPTKRPMTSWSAGATWAFTIGIYPDSWLALTGVAPQQLLDRHVDAASVLSADLLACLDALDESDDFRTGFERLQDRLEAKWRGGAGGMQARLDGWLRSLSTGAAIASVGARQAQRLAKLWTGQSLRDLRSYARVERLGVAASGGAVDLAGLAADSGFSDQSHMGREVRRVTGHSPARIGRLTATDESYWAYELLAARAMSPDEAC